MKFIQKIFYIFISIYSLILLFYFIFNKQIFYHSITNTIILWFEKVLPAISISYIISLYLYNYPLISYILYPILKKVFYFENHKACSLFLVSLLVGNPTSSKLIVDAVNNKEISTSEGNRLLKFSSFVSGIFIYSVFDFNLFLIIILIELIISIILAQGSPSIKKVQSNNVKNNKTFLDLYFNIVNTIPMLLLSILTSMIICNLFSITINNEYLKSLFELTIGISIINKLPHGFIRLLTLFILLISQGIAIILQVYWVIKKTSLSFINFIKYRIYAVLISIISLSIIYLFVFFL